MSYMPKDDFLAFAKEYVEEAGSSLDQVTLSKGNSALGLIDLTGMTCVRCSQDPLGYEIFEYQDSEGRKALLMNCRMTTTWVAVQ